MTRAERKKVDKNITEEDQVIMRLQGFVPEPIQPSQHNVSYFIVSEHRDVPQEDVIPVYWYRR